MSIPPALEWAGGPVAAVGPVAGDVVAVVGELFAAGDDCRFGDGGDPPPLLCPDGASPPFEPLSADVCLAFGWSADDEPPDVEPLWAGGDECEPDGDCPLDDDGEDDFPECPPRPDEDDGGDDASERPLRPGEDGDPDPEPDPGGGAEPVLPDPRPGPVELGGSPGCVPTDAGGAAGAMAPARTPAAATVPGLREAALARTMSTMVPIGPGMNRGVAGGGAG